jgi:RNA-directed DNA polymerase
VIELDLKSWLVAGIVPGIEECFSFIQDWVDGTAPYVAGPETEGLRRARWSRQWLHETLQLFNSYKVRWFQPKVTPAG